MKYIFYLILFFLYIFGPVFNRLGSWADTIFIISFLLFIKNFLLRKNWIPSYTLVFLLIVPVFLYAAFLITIFPGVRTSDYVQVLLKPVRILVTLLGGFSLVYDLYKAYGKESTIITVELIFLSIVLHAGIMILQFYNKEFKDFIYSFTTTGVFKAYNNYQYRMGGLSGDTGGAVLSVTQSLGVLLLPFVTKNSSRLKNIIFISLGIVVVYSIMICGRSGILSVILFLPLSWMLVNGSLKVKTILKILFIILVLAFSLSVLINFTSKVEKTNPLRYAFERTLSTFIDYKRTGKVEDVTLKILSSQIVFPDKMQTFLFGNGEYVVDRGTNRTLNSDIGYIVNIWGLGIFAFAVYITPILLFLYISFVLRGKYMSSALLLLITLVMLFFHAKELFLYVRMLFSMYSLSLALLFIESKSYHFRSLRTMNENG